MREILKIEDCHTSKRIIASLIDVVICAVLGVILMFGCFNLLFTSNPEYIKNADYIRENRNIEGAYNLNLGNNLDYQEYYDQGKSFYIYYEKEILALYLEDLNEEEAKYLDKSNPEEVKKFEAKKERYSHIEYIFNTHYIGLPFEPTIDDINSYTNKYFKFVIENDKIVYDAWAVDYTERVQDLNPRGIAERKDYCYTIYSSLVGSLRTINPNFTKAEGVIGTFTNISTFLSGFISYLVCYLIIPLSFKNGETIAKKMIGYGYVNKDNTPLKKSKIFIKYLVGALITSISFYFFTVYTVFIFLLFPYAINLFYSLLNSKDIDILDKHLKIRLINIKESLIFNNEKEADEYFNNLDEEVSEEDREYTERLNRLASLNVKSIEEQILEENDDANESK